MKITNTTLKDYFKWYCYTSYATPTDKEIAESITDYAWFDDNNFSEEYLLSKINENIIVIECEKCNGSNDGSHDVAIICEEFVMRLESIDYAFTPYENSNTI